LDTGMSADRNAFPEPVATTCGHSLI
jgi:hypothetical protein